MSQDDMTQIRIEKHVVGIMGLKSVLEEMAEGFDEKPDDEIQGELLKRLSKKNYIPSPAKDNYGSAFLREFKKFLGKPYEGEAAAGLTIKVLGQGCVQCDRLEKELMEVMSELNLVADLEHVRDIKEIGRYGVMGMPALIINGTVKCVGKVPSRNQLTAWLTKAEGQRPGVG